MAVALIQPSFAAGELAPALYGRVDVNKYHIGLATCRNMQVNYRGGAYSRAGTKFVGFSGQTGRNFPPRLVTFQFSINQGLALEFGNLYMRVISNGAFVTETPKAITGITNANPGVLHVPAHGFLNGDWAFLTGIGGMTQLNGQTLIVAGATTNFFSLTDVYGTPIDTTTFGAYTSGGTAARIFTLVTPWGEADLKFLKWTQSADVMSICCWNQTTGTLYPTYELVRLADDNWTVTQLSTAATIAPPATISGVATVVASNADATHKHTDFQYVVTAINKTDSSESIASPIADIPNSVDIALTAGSINLNWAGVVGAKYYNVYKAPPAYGSTVPVGSFFGYAGSTFGTSFVDSNITQDFAQVPPTHTDPFGGINGGGAITDILIGAGGSALTTVTWAITTATGSGFAGAPIIVGGVMTGFNITDEGTGYAGGDTIAFNGAGVASGSILFAANPTAGSTITLNGVVWTFVSTITGANQTLIQATLDVTLDVLVAGLSAASSASLNVASYTDDSTHLFVIYKTPGTAGNAYTLAASVATPSGGTLTGGAGLSGAQATGSYTFTGNPTAAQNIVLNGITWTFVAGAPSGNQTQIQGSTGATVTQLASDLNASGVGAISAATYTPSGSVLNISYDTFGSVGNTYAIAAGTYGGTPSGAHLTGGVDPPNAPTGTLVLSSSAGNFPSVVSYFQQRRVYAATPNQPDTYFMSQPGRFTNFDSRLPIIDSDAIIGTPWSVLVDGIQFMIPMPGGLVTLTGSSAWQLTGAGGSSLNPQPITPASQQAQPQAYNGCSNHVPPIKIDYDINYVQAKGSILRDLAYNFFTNIYTGTDLTYLSSQLFTGYTIREMAWAEEPHKIIWVNRDDGTLLSLTYLKAQEVMGWARHDTLGEFWSICSVIEPPVDALYLVSERQAMV